MNSSSPSSNTLTPRILASTCDGVTLTLIPPSTSSNFLGYNKLCTALDGEYLMQPINEAQYDSETQACVDRLQDGPQSFYDHYVSQPTKKKGRSVGVECPMSHVYDSVDMLAPPSLKGVPQHPVDRSVLQDPVARRLATGRMPQ